MHTHAVTSLKILLLHSIISRFSLITRAPLHYVCIRRSDPFSASLMGAIACAHT